jgi:hypothetical protein
MKAMAGDDHRLDLAAPGRHRPGEDGRIVGISAAVSAGSEQQVVGEVVGAVAQVFDPGGPIESGSPAVDVEQDRLRPNIPAWKEVRIGNPGNVSAGRLSTTMPIVSPSEKTLRQRAKFRHGRPDRRRRVGRGHSRQLAHSGPNCRAGEFGMVLKDSILGHCEQAVLHQEYGIKGDRPIAPGGDREALPFEQFSATLGCFMIMLAVDPEAIIWRFRFRDFPFFEGAMRERMKVFPYHKILERIVIEVSAEPHIAILGAAALYLDARQP